MEDRLCASAAQLSMETNDEELLAQMGEQRALSERIQHEVQRKVTKGAIAVAYDESEMYATKDQSALAALIACMKEVKRTLQERGPTGVTGTQDDLDVAMD